MLLGVDLGGWGDFILGDCSIYLNFCLSLELLKKSLIETKLVGVCRLRGLVTTFGELNTFYELI